MEAEEADRLLQEYLNWREDGFKRDVKLTFHRKRQLLGAPRNGNRCWQSARPIGPHGVQHSLTLVHDVCRDEFCLCLFDTMSREEQRAKLPSSIADRIRGQLLDPEDVLQSFDVDDKGRIVFSEMASRRSDEKEMQAPTPATTDGEALQDESSRDVHTASPDASAGAAAEPCIADVGDDCVPFDAAKVGLDAAGTRAGSPVEAAEAEGEANGCAGGVPGRAVGDVDQKAGDSAKLGDASDADVVAWVQAEKKLLVYVCTWNMMGKDVPPREGLQAHVLPPDRYHVYVIGTQECERSIAKSALNPAKKAWEAAVQDCLGERYHKISSHTLQATNLIAFVHGALEHMVHGVATSAVACGIGNTMGNKGGIGLRFSVADSDLCFVTAHLSASRDANGAAQRSADFRRISTGLTRALSTRTVPDERVLRGGEGAYRCLLPHFDHVFFFGDLNYRLEGGERDAVVALIEQGSTAQLVAVDQLTVERRHGSAFVEYCEGQLGFAPTYKFDKGVDVYDTGPKRRCPAWTDRVLYKADAAELVEYGCHREERLSDHRPVFGVFAVALELGDGMHGDKDRGSIGRTESQVCSVQ